MLPGRSLWLRGIPGAGKTVLCATIIESIKSHQVDPLVFYFDYSDQGMQSLVNMLSSSLAQLSIQHVPNPLRNLYKTCGKGTRDVTVSQLKFARTKISIFW
jgi:hypothetical protein